MSESGADGNIVRTVTSLRIRKADIAAIVDTPGRSFVDH
jgi:hypothetical protein